MDVTLGWETEGSVVRVEAATVDLDDAPGIAARIAEGLFLVLIAALMTLLVL